MIFVDTNVFVIDLRYKRDRLFPVNRRFIDRLGGNGRGVTGPLNVLETCGILSYNLSPRLMRDLFEYFSIRYKVLVIPAPTSDSLLLGYFYCNTFGASDLA